MSDLQGIRDAESHRISGAVQSGTNAEPSRPGMMNRSQVITDLTHMALDAAYGIQRSTEEQMSQVLSSLVREKLMTADDSYAMKDSLSDRDRINEAIDHRIDAALRRKGIITNDLLQELRSRITRLEDRRRPS